MHDVPLFYWRLPLIGIYCIPRRLKAAAIAFCIRTWRKLERKRSSISRNILRITRFQDTTKFPRDISTYDGVNNGSLHSPEAAANSCEYRRLKETHLLQSTQVLKNVSIRTSDIPIVSIWYDTFIIFTFQLWQKLKLRNVK